MFQKKIFIDRLTFMRQQQKLAKRQLAFKVGISPRAIGQFEQGENLPSIETLVQLAQVLGVSLDYLCGVTDIMHRDPPPMGVKEGENSMDSSLDLTPPVSRKMCPECGSGAFILIPAQAAILVAGRQMTTTLHVCRQCGYVRQFVNFVPES